MLTAHDDAGCDVWLDDTEFDSGDHIFAGEWHVENQDECWYRCIAVRTDCNAVTWGHAGKICWYQDVPDDVQTTASRWEVFTTSRRTCPSAHLSPLFSLPYGRVHVCWQHQRWESASHEPQRHVALTPAQRCARVFSWPQGF